MASTLTTFGPTSAERETDADNAITAWDPLTLVFLGSGTVYAPPVTADPKPCDTVRLKLSLTTTVLVAACTGTATSAPIARAPTDALTTAVPKYDRWNMCANLHRTNPKA